MKNAKKWKKKNIENIEIAMNIHWWGGVKAIEIKGSVSRDFWPQFFSMIRSHMGPW